MKIVSQILLSAALALVFSTAHAYPGPGFGHGGRPPGHGGFGGFGGHGPGPGIGPHHHGPGGWLPPRPPMPPPPPHYGGPGGYYPPPQPQGLNSRRLVNVLFRGALARQADPQAQRYFSEMIDCNGRAGVIRAAQEIGGGQEMSQVVWRNGARAVVQRIYRVFFNRMPDAGAEYWVNLLQQGRGAEALAGIVGSDEFARTQLY